MRTRAFAAGRCAALALGCLLLACVTAEGERLAYIAETLERRAEHLQASRREEIARALLRAERLTGVDAILLLAVIEEESHFDLEARGRRGALGLMQVRPETGRAVCVRHGFPWDGETTLFEPESNLVIGATYLAELRERFGVWDLALTAYNAGPATARRAATRGRSPSSPYAARVLERFESLRPPA